MNFCSLFDVFASLLPGMKMADSLPVEAFILPPDESDFDPEDLAGALVALATQANRDLRDRCCAAADDLQRIARHMTTSFDQWNKSSLPDLVRGILAGLERQATTVIPRQSNRRRLSAAISRVRTLLDRAAKTNDDARYLRICLSLPIFGDQQDVEETTQALIRAFDELREDISDLCPDEAGELLQGLAPFVVIRGTPHRLPPLELCYKEKPAGIPSLSKLERLIVSVATRLRGLPDQRYSAVVLELCEVAEALPADAENLDRKLLRQLSELVNDLSSDLRQDEGDPNVVVAAHLTGLICELVTELSEYRPQADNSRMTVLTLPIHGPRRRVADLSQRLLDIISEVSQTRLAATAETYGWRKITLEHGYGFLPPWVEADPSELPAGVQSNGELVGNAATSG
jgi:hypothetical protein